MYVCDLLQKHFYFEEAYLKPWHRPAGKILESSLLGERLPNPTESFVLPERERGFLKLKLTDDRVLCF